MELIFDLHTHTRYSHGKGSIEDNAAAAFSKGLEILGISDHGPGHKFYGFRMSDIPQMRKDIADAEEKFPGLKIKLGAEANIYQPSGAIDISKEDQKLFDYIMAGYHYGLVSSEEPLRSLWIAGTGRIGLPSRRTKDHLTDLVIAALYSNDLAVLTHPGDKIMVDIDEVSKACEETDTAMEINCHHLALSADSLRKAMKYNVRFIIGSDAHVPQLVGDPSPCCTILSQSGLDTDRIINLRR